MCHFPRNPLYGSVKIRDFHKKIKRSRIFSSAQTRPKNLRLFNVLMKISNFYAPYNRLRVKWHMFYTCCNFFKSIWTFVHSQIRQNQEKKGFEENAIKVSGQRWRYELPLDRFSCQINNFANFNINQPAFYSEKIIFLTIGVVFPAVQDDVLH